MRPYWAVIRDSFREAWASRVLWILLALITVVLLAILPFGWTRQLTVDLRRDDVRDSSRLAQRLQSALSETPPSTASYVASRLPDELQSRLKSYAPSDDKRSTEETQLRDDLVTALDSLIQQPDFYRADLWKETKWNQEAQSLVERGVDHLASREQQRLNRLALEATFPREIRQRPSQTVVFGYLIWDVGEPVRIGDAQLDQVIREFVAAFISIVLGMIGVFAAILVTAPIIPNMLDTGSFSLLLSKPVSRPLLFLAKFFGGCWFVLINATYLIAGLWLLLGLRFEIWYKNLLWCIPIFLFLFIVYYSVSAFAGLVWRNTVVCIVVTILFWFLCVLVGGAKQTVELFFVHPDRLIKLLPVDDGLLAVNERGRVQEWSAEQAGWRQVFATGGAAHGPPFAMGPQIVGPVYDSQQQRLVAVVPAWPEALLYLGPRADGWEPVESGAAPQRTRWLLTEPDGKVLAVTSEGLLRMVSDPKPSVDPLELFGFRIPLPGEDRVFEPAGGDRSVRMNEATSVALSHDTGVLYVLQGDWLTSFVCNEKGVYEKQNQIETTQEERQAVLAAGGDTVLVACAKGTILLRDAHDLTVKKRLAMDQRAKPRFAVAAPDGSRMAVLFHDRHLSMIDTQQEAPEMIHLAGQGEITAAVFEGSDRLVVADQIDRVAVYRLPSGEVERWYKPTSKIMRRVYHYVINPLYTVFPRPGELDSSIGYLMTEQDTVALGPNTDDLSSAQLQVDPWSPVWSSLAFVVVMLVLACLYIQRQDF